MQQRADAEEPAGHGDKGAGLLRRYQPGGGQRRSFPAAKKAAACLSRSRSCFRRAFSRRSVRSSSSSGWSPHRCARGGQPRLVGASSGASLRHTEARGELARGVRPARNICTASRRNSGGYAGRVLGTLDTILARRAGASRQMSGKAGELHSRRAGQVRTGGRLRRKQATGSGSRPLGRESGRPTDRSSTGHGLRLQSMRLARLARSRQPRLPAACPREQLDACRARSTARPLATGGPRSRSSLTRESRRRRRETGRRRGTRPHEARQGHHRGLRVDRSSASSRFGARAARGMACRSHPRGPGTQVLRSNAPASFT